MQEQEEIKTPSFTQPWRIFAIEAFLFCLTLGLGIAAAFRINKILEVAEVLPHLPPHPISWGSAIEKIALPQISFWKFLTAFFLATLFIFLIIRFLKFKRGKGLIFKILFTLAVFLGGLLFLEAFFLEPIPLILISFLIFWWWKSPSILNQDLLMVLGMAGVGSTLGLSLKPEMVIVLLIIFSIYDYIAVYKTKHMIKMAKEMIEQKAILALVVPPNLLGFQESLGEIRPGGKFLILGGGDIVFPLLFSASLIPFGILNSIIVALFALIGLFLGFYFFISQKIRQPIPALPPIALFSIIGFLITRII